MLTRVAHIQKRNFPLDAPLLRCSIQNCGVHSCAQERHLLSQMRKGNAPFHAKISSCLVPRKLTPKERELILSNKKRMNHLSFFKHFHETSVPIEVVSVFRESNNFHLQFSQVRVKLPREKQCKQHVKTERVPEQLMCDPPKNTWRLGANKQEETLSWGGRVAPGRPSAHKAASCSANSGFPRAAPLSAAGENRRTSRWDHKWSFVFTALVAIPSELRIECACN